MPHNTYFNYYKWVIKFFNDNKKKQKIKKYKQKVRNKKAKDRNENR